MHETGFVYSDPKPFNILDVQLSSISLFGTGKFL